jgi:zinc/manganese transport system substrate-binding protein
MKSSGIHAMRAAALLLALAAAQPLTAQLKVVATLPDLAAVAKEIGGTAVDVTALAKATEDPHFVDAKPSHVVTLNRADVLIEGGAGLEQGWLPALLQGVRNTKIAAGAPGRITANAHVKMLEVPTALDRSQGDVHAQGNPHFMIDPANAKLVATEIATRLAQIDPKNAALYQGNLAKFNTSVDQKTTAWTAALAPFKGAKIVTYHRDFVYLADRFGLEVVGTLEEKPGIAPSPAHLAQVIQTMKTQNAKAILVQPYQNRRTAETVARQAGGIVLDTPQEPGAVKGTDTYVAMMDNLINALVGGLRGGR